VVSSEKSILRFNVLDVACKLFLLVACAVRWAYNARSRLAVHRPYVASLAAGSNS
jgi:hypothetical protein